MLVIQYPKNVLLGGFGDRVVGLISVKLISKLLKKEFYISWDKENIREYMDYAKYDFELLNIEDRKGQDYHYIDNQQGLKKHLMTSSNPFPSTINYFNLNQEIAQYLYKNELFEKENYFEDVFNEYKTLYTEILIPTDYLMNQISKIVADKQNIVGIQIRCGDYFISNNIGHQMFAQQYHNSEKYRTNIDFYLLKMKQICDRDFNNDYNIFFTTDNIELLHEVYKVFGKSKVMYDDSLIQHLDRECIDSDISKVFIDNYILSQKTKMLFISQYSGFGRIAALSCEHNNIYNLDSQLISKKTLLSKHEMLFH